MDDGVEGEGAEVVGDLGGNGEVEGLAVPGDEAVALAEFAGEGGAEAAAGAGDDEAERRNGQGHGKAGRGPEAGCYRGWGGRSEDKKETG